MADSCSGLLHPTGSSITGKYKIRQQFNLGIFIIQNCKESLVGGINFLHMHFKNRSFRNVKRKICIKNLRDLFPSAHPVQSVHKSVILYKPNIS